VTTGFVLDKVIAAVQLAIVARLLTPADFGLMAASAVVLVAIMMLSEVGIEPALVTRKDPSSSDLAVAWTLSLGRSLILALTVWALADGIAWFFRAPDLALLLRVHAVGLLLQGAQSPALALLQRNLDLRRRVRYDLARRLVEATATIALALWLRNVWALLGGQLIAFAFGCAFSYRMAPFAPWLSLSTDSVMHFLRFGRQFNVTVVLILLVTSGGEFVVGRLLGVDALGLYQVAMTIPVLLGTRLSIVMHQISFPTYAILREDKTALARAFALQMGIGGVVLLPLASCLAILAPDLVALVFGPRWLATVEPLRILSLYAVCAGFSGIMASLHYGLNRPDIQRRIWTVQFIVYAIGVLPLTARFGVPGAAAALTVSYVVGLLLHLRATERLLGAEMWSALSTFGRVSLVLAVTATMWSLVRRLEPDPQALWTMAVGGVTTASMYGLYFWLVEYPRLRRLWAGLPQQTG
jgi:PST family polysaccharide transporter/lipopolysaccharide exporter